MKDLFRLAWDRFGVIASVIADVQSWLIVTVFYYTILVPFGLISRLNSDPLRIKEPAAGWLEREPIPQDIDSARQQG